MSVDTFDDPSGNPYTWTAPANGTIRIDATQSGAGGGNIPNGSGGGAGGFGRINAYPVAAGQEFSIDVPLGGDPGAGGTPGAFYDVTNDNFLFDAGSSTPASPGDDLGLTPSAGGQWGEQAYPFDLNFSGGAGATGLAGGAGGGAATVSGAGADGGGASNSGDGGAGNNSPGRNGKFVVTFTASVPPTITSNGGGSTASISVVENHTAVTTVTATGDATISFSITGGADQAKFSINSSSGVLTFASAPDYEHPTDANADNAYIVAVTATNSAGTDVQTITATVTNDASDDASGSPKPRGIGIWIGVGL